MTYVRLHRADGTCTGFCVQVFREIIMEGLGFKVERIVVLNKRWCTRKRTEKIGIARESLLLWRKV